jgi:UDP-N-acetylmuramoyl-tripeptide--D-alanyl-D-alanine ligase
MSAWTEAAVTAALAIATPADSDAVVYANVSTDTRTLAEGDLFVALRGPNHDAHDHLMDAASSGARGAVVERIPDGAPVKLRYHVVADTLEALGRLGRFHRRRVGARVCAVAGSNGKTTTKELLRLVLSTRYQVHATTANFNNLVGVPLTLLSCPAAAEVIVAEVGTNAPGEVARLGGIVEPDAAVVTNISAEHLEGLGDLDGVLREETALLPWLPAGAPAVVPDEPAVLAERARTLADNVRVVGFGERASAGLRGSELALDASGRVRFRWAGHEVQLQLRGHHNARNALVALAVGRAWNVDDEAAVAALTELVPPKLRAEFHQYGDITVIADCYNANPGSVHAAIELLTGVPRQGGRVAVLGTMLEMGAASEVLHRETARDVAGREIDLIVATGAFATAFEPLAAELGERLLRVEDPLEAWDRLVTLLSGDEVVLLKGSRGVALERLLPRFQEIWGELHPHGEAFGSRASSTGTRASEVSEEHPHTSSHDGGPAPHALGG